MSAIQKKKKEKEDEKKKEEKDKEKKKQKQKGIVNQSNEWIRITIFSDHFLVHHIQTAAYDGLFALMHMV